MRGTGSGRPRGGERQRDNIICCLLQAPQPRDVENGPAPIGTQHHTCVWPSATSWHHWHPVVSMASVSSTAGVLPVLGNAAGSSPGCSPACYAWTYTHLGRSPALCASPSSLGTDVTHPVKAGPQNTQGTGSSGYQGRALETLSEAPVQLPAGPRSWIQPGASAGSCHTRWAAQMWCCAPWHPPLLSCGLWLDTTSE